jgi:sulfide:quinone oxidoreductase
MDLKHLGANLAVAPQIRPADVAGLAAAGFKGIVNTRPDDEAPDQPRSLELEKEAKRHGLLYRHIPVVPGQANESDARAFAAAVEETGGPVVAFCRTGNRAETLWKMTQAASRHGGTSERRP